MIYLFNKDVPLPDPLQEKDDIVAIGGELSVERLLEAYGKGIFPWFSDDEPILWWCPHERMVLIPNELKVSKSMKQVLKKGQFKVTFDTNFEDVIYQCSSIERIGQPGTWITEKMIKAYINLHKARYAHSVEVWEQENLVGGLYGVALGKCFFGESMFSKVSNASKAGFITLVNKLLIQNYQLIDCQVYTEHLESLGARLITKESFLIKLKEGLNMEM